MAKKVKKQLKKRVASRGRTKKVQVLVRKPFLLAVAVASGVSLLFILGIVSTVKYKARQEIETDHLKPLVITNLPYCNGEKLDLFVPSRSEPVPLVVYVHGGGWEYGSKVGDLVPAVKSLLYDGYAVASINYRLSRSAKFPAQIQDVTCAVRFLRTKAEDYRLDSTRIGLIGLSAGGHLAALAANASERPDFVAGPYQEQSSNVQAIVSVSGVLDLESAALTRITNANMDLLFAGTNYTRALANPTRYIDANDPPQFIIYATNDAKVPRSQSVNYYKLLQQHDIPAQLLEVQHAEHSLNPFLSLSTKPNRSEIIESIAQFMNQHLMP